jgi:hypothetical protein
VTSAAAVLQEGRPTAAATADLAQLKAARVASPSSADSRLMVTTIVLVQTGWFGVLGYLAYRLFA